MPTKEQIELFVLDPAVARSIAAAEESGGAGSGSTRSEGPQSSAGPGLTGRSAVDGDAGLADNASVEERETALRESFQEFLLDIGSDMGVEAEAAAAAAAEIVAAYGANGNGTRMPRDTAADLVSVSVADASPNGLVANGSFGSNGSNGSGGGSSSSSSSSSTSISRDERLDGDVVTVAAAPVGARAAVRGGDDGSSSNGSGSGVAGSQ
jgi:hypothetical protein